MHRLRIVLIFLMVGLAPACPAFFEPTGEPPGTSGGSNGPTSTGADSPTSASASDPTTASGTATTGDGSSTSGGPPPLDDTWCDALDPAQVYVLGTYVSHASYRDAIGRIDVDRGGCVGFGDYAEHLVVRPTDGRLLYLDSIAKGVGISLFVRDEQVWNADDGAWEYPDDPYANDELVPTVACVVAPRKFSVHPVNGSLVYTCENEAANNYYDEDGALLYTTDGYHDPEVLVGPGDTLIVWDFTEAADYLKVVPFGQAEIPVEPPNGYPMSSVLTVRARADGYWVVVKPGPIARIERWLIKPDGSGAVEGEYGGTEKESPNGIISANARLAGDGSLVFLRDDPVDSDRVQVLRANLGPGKLAILYDSAGVPEDSWPYDPDPHVYVDYYTSDLFTGA